ncbi:hypothetical protein ACHQM5_004926 [Ranunculus cassubicifolius]
MDKVYESEKSSRRHRDEREKDRDSNKDHHREHRERDRDHRHRNRESEERHHGDKYREEKHHRSKDYHEESKRERSLEPRNGREGSRERGHREKSIEIRSSDRYQSRDYSFDHEESNQERSHEPRDRREGSRDERVSREVSVERPLLKRKERADSEERSDKGEKRRKEDKREKRRFEDKVENSRDLNGTKREEKRENSELEGRVKEERMEDGNGGSNRNGRRERRRFGDRANEDEHVSSNQSSSMKYGSVPELLHMTSNANSEPSFTPDHPPPTKVSSISTPNENKGVSVTRSHEVPGKSSTDGTTSAAGKSGNLSLEAIVKAKELLQKQKELKEKLKKLPLNKVSNSTTDNTQQVGLHKDGSKSSSTSTLPASTSLSAKPSASAVPTLPGLSAIPNIEAVKRAQELAAKMGFHHDPEFAPIINMFPGQQMPTDVTLQQKPAKAPVLRLDQYGNAVDEHGNVINMSKPTNLSTLKVNINKQKKDAFQILKPELDVDPNSNPHFDERMGINKAKLLRPKRMSFQFVEEGQWSKQAEIIKFKSQFGEAQAKELRTKQAQFAKSKFDSDINPNLIEVAERVITKEKPKDPIPEVEWWDVPLLKSGKYGELTDGKIDEANFNWEKITIYVEHPRPIEPPAEPAPPPPQPLKLTKKEQKKMRTQRRLAKEKDRQEMIRQGLIEPPKPKVKMSNLMKVLGSEATQDPTRMEMEVRTAAAEREQAHIDRNISRKLTPGEKREKAERKLFEDRNNLETIVSVYKINDLSHPQTRFKVDVNAQENKLTGCVVMGENMTVVVVEGGGKAIKRYSHLMTKRIKWAEVVAEEGEDDMDRPPNKCVLVWQGSVARPNFHKFLVHECRTEGAARKVFSDAGVVHYWDLAANFMDDQV